MERLAPGTARCFRDRIRHRRRGSDSRSPGSEREHRPVRLTIALAGLELTVAVSWAISLDIGGDFSGSVSAVMNTLGNLGGASSSVVIGYLATHLGWNWPFLVASAMCGIAALLATRINPNRSAVAA